ncbi:GSCOCG00010418001-RA-CDS, partial [Cotesia congregata]
FREVAVEIGKVLFSHESRILTPGGGAVSPGGTQPPASPPTGHYSQHSPPLIKVFIILYRSYNYSNHSHNYSNISQKLGVQFP